MSKSVGREALVVDLVNRLNEGQTVVVYGPPGIGKSALLAAIREQVLRREIPCGLAVRTMQPSDITCALASAYPEVAPCSSQRLLRSRLRDAVQKRPGVLLLDHFRSRSTATKGFLRSLRGTGLGIIIAADTFAERDHASLRALCLSSIELKVPPLGLRYQRELWHGWATALQLSVSKSDTDAVLKLAEGRPGYLEFMASVLAGRSRLDGSRLLIHTAHVDVIAKLALSDVTHGTPQEVHGDR